MLGFPGGPMVKNPPFSAGDMGSIPGAAGMVVGAVGMVLQEWWWVKLHVLRSKKANVPQLLSQCPWSLYSPAREATTMRSLCITTGGRLLEAMRTQHTQK